MFGRPSKTRKVAESRKLPRFGKSRRSGDRGDALAGALVAIAITATFAVIGTQLYSFISSGQSTATANTQATIRAHVTQALGQRISMPDYVSNRRGSIDGATVQMTEILNSINQDPSIQYEELLRSASPSNTIGTNTYGHTLVEKAFDIGTADVGDLWVFVAPNIIKLCETEGKRGAPTQSLSDRVQFDNNLGDITGVDNSACAASSDNLADVRVGRAIFVGGVAEGGSQFCVKYTQANANFDSNGFAYWHTKDYPGGSALDYHTGGTQSIEALNDLRADCGVHWILGTMLHTGGAVKVYHPAVVTPTLCAADSPRGNPENVVC